MSRVRFALLSGAIVLSSVVLLVLPGARSGAHEAKAAAPGEVEVAAARTRTSNTFRLPDGSLKTVVSTGSVNYQDDAGGWRPIDSSVVATQGTTDFAWRNKANRYVARFKNDVEPGFLELSLGGHVVTFNAVGAASGHWANPHGNKLDFPAAFRGASLHYAFGPDALKETIELADRSAPSSFQFTFSSDADELSVSRLSDGSYAVIAAGQAQPLFVIAAPVVRDSAPGARWSGEPVSMSVRARAAGVFEVTVRLDSTWLSAAARVFPVFVDPTIAIQTVAKEAEFQWNCGFTPCTGVDGQEENSVGVWGASQTISRDAVQFDLSAVPAGASVSNAKLDLYYNGTCYPASGCALSHALNAHKITSSWVQTPVSSSSALTWDSTPLNGGQAVTLPASAATQWLSWDVTSAVQSWTGASPQSNYGFLVKQNSETAAGGYVNLVSHLYTGDASLRPKLEVTYAGDDVTLFPPDTLHSTGAALSWSKYTGPSGAAFQKYEVHRSQSAGFTPGA